MTNCVAGWLTGRLIQQVLPQADISSSGFNFMLRQKIRLEGSCLRWVFKRKWGLCLVSLPTAMLPLCHFAFTKGLNLKVNPLEIACLLSTFAYLNLDVEHFFN